MLKRHETKLVFLITSSRFPDFENGPFVNPIKLEIMSNY